MYIKKVKLKYFRNFDNTEIEFNDGVNFIIDCLDFAFHKISCIDLFL